MDAKEVTRKWFDLWESGDFLALPISEDFKHTSPYGTIEGKKAYLDLVAANKDKFLGHRFELHDELYDQDKSCVRYTAIQEDFQLVVTEWHYIANGLIEQIIAYYTIDTSERALSDA